MTEAVANLWKTPVTNVARTTIFAKRSSSMDNSKREVMLQFTDLHTLSKYTHVVNVNNCEVIRARFMLICALNEEEIALAIAKYQAVIVEKE